MITVLTCTYNRDKYLPYLYQSLKNQTSYDFEWLVIDDGSTDNTEFLIKEISTSEKNFNINYQKQENGGKHRSINKGMEFVQGAYIFLVDSDDRLCFDTIEKVQKWLEEIDTDVNIVGVAGLMAKKDGQILGRYPNKKKYQRYIDARCVDRGRYHLTGDKALIFKTDIMKQYRFPEFDNEKFLLEGTVWNSMSLDGYKIRWYPEVIYIADYLEDGLTNDKYKLINNWKGYTLTTQITIKASKGIQRLSPIARYIMYGKIKNMVKSDIMQQLNITEIEYYVADTIQGLYSKWRKVK